MEASLAHVFEREAKLNVTLKEANDIHEAKQKGRDASMQLTMKLKSQLKKLISKRKKPNGSAPATRQKRKRDDNASAGGEVS